MKNKDKYNLSELTASKGMVQGVPCMFIYQGRDIENRKLIATVVRTVVEKRVDTLFDWLEQNCPPLTDEEREYLSSVIKPWRYRVKAIIKQERLLMELIVIKCQDGWEVELPNFEMGTMYKDMELDRKYTLEELGL